MVDIDDGKLWVTESRYTFDEAMQFKHAIPACPLADIQAEEYDALRDLVQGTILHTD
jgi:hypothetical protein